MFDIIYIIGGVVVAAIAAYLGGRRDGAKSVKKEQAEAEKEAVERMLNDADVGSGDSDADREWLRERSRK